MPKIKGWKKIGYASSGGAWENEIRRNIRIVVDFYAENWYVIKQVYTPTKGTNDTTIKKGKFGRSKANGLAIEWMKNHPRG